MSGDAERGEVAMADKTGPTALRDTRPTISRTTWLVIVLLAFVGQVAWAVENNFLNLFVQDSFGASLQDVALMVSASALTATLTTLFVGAWSDRVRRRKVFVVAGAALWGVSIIGFAAIQGISDALSPDAAQAARMGVTLTIIFDCVMTFFGSLSNDAAFNAWLTGVTDETNRGRVEGVNSAMPLIAMLAVFGGAMALMHVGDDGTVTYDYPSLFVAVGVLVGAAAVVAGVLMRDSHPAPTVEQAWLHGVARGFSPAAMRENPVLYLVLLGYCIFSTALQVFMPYYVLYLRLPYVLGEGYVFVMAPGIVIAAVFTIFYGRRLDRLGFERAVRLPLALFVAGCLVLTLLTSVAGRLCGLGPHAVRVSGGRGLLCGRGAQQYSGRPRGGSPGRAHVHGCTGPHACGTVDWVGGELRVWRHWRLWRGGGWVYSLVAHLLGGGVGVAGGCSHAGGNRAAADWGALTTRLVLMRRNSPEWGFHTA